MQGEAMGTQLGLRMLGDAIICLVGGVLILLTIKLPILISGFIAAMALLFFIHKTAVHSDLSRCER